MWSCCVNNKTCRVSKVVAAHPREGSLHVMMVVGHTFYCHARQATHGGFILSAACILKKTKKKTVKAMVLLNGWTVPAERTEKLAKCHCEIGEKEYQWLEIAKDLELAEAEDLT